MELRWTTAACLAFALCIAHPVLISCEYSVRDAAFVGYRHEEYRLSILVDGKTSLSTRAMLEEVALIHFLDSNVRFGVVDRFGRHDDPLLNDLLGQVDAALPAAMLSAPDGRFLSVPLARGGEITRQETWRIFEGLVASPAREDVTRHIVEALNVVLLVEGTGQEDNDRARDAAAGAIEQIAEMMPFFPKPVHAPARLDEPPRLVTLSREAQAEEAVLLWSLGLDRRPADTPHVVVLHGRGRVIGRPLAGTEIDRFLLARVLSMSGQDCECGLPRSWLQGRLIPLRWDDEVVAPLVRSLGFNPESPAVIDEVSRIVGAGRNGAGGGSSDELPAISLGYNEIEVEWDDSSSETRSETREPVAGNEAVASTQPAPGDDDPSIGTPLLMTCILVALAVLVWGFVIMRRREWGGSR